VSALATAPLELFGQPRGEPLTLEERLELELGSALSGRPAACPACGGRMTRAGEAEAGCGDCGASLS
jgi:tRNA(Ile2) C34 agmatinyltransferase TiaS